MLISDNFNKLCISSNLEIIKDVMNNSGPKNIMLIVGYTGWKKGQLEEEVNNNLWIVSARSRNVLWVSMWQHADFADIPQSVNLEELLKSQN